ncbi:MAG: hypothetical protein U0T82_07950 [Bacteroidales bacterium]
MDRDGMKHITITGLIILSVSFGNIQGQHRSGTIWYSMFAGASYSNMLGEGTRVEAILIDYPANPRLNAEAGEYFIWGKKGGFGLSFEFPHKTLISFDLGYEEKGCRIPLHQVSAYSPVEQGVSGQLLDKRMFCNERIRYISIPLKAEKQFRYFYFQIGQYTAVRLSAKEYGTVQLNNEKFEYRSTGNYALLDLGMLLGTGLSLTLSKWYTLRVGVSGSWNVTGNNRRVLEDEPGSFFYNQSLQAEVRLLRRIDRRRCYGI